MARTTGRRSSWPRPSPWRTSGKKGITPNGARDQPKKAHTVLNDVNSLKFTGKLKGGPGLD